MLFSKKGKHPQEEEEATSGTECQTATRRDQPGSSANASNSMDPKGKQRDITYPTGIKLALLMMSIFVGMFLSSLVRSQFTLFWNCRLTDPARRINLSSRPPSLRSPTTSTQRTTLAGMARRTCSPTAPSSSCSGRYTKFSASKPPFWPRSYCSRPAQLSAVQRRTRSLSSSAGPSQAWDREALSRAS